MTFEPKSIHDHIECLGRLTGAPASFVDQVKQLFIKKGITLDTAATPYLTALEEAFQREESIRANALRTRNEVSRMQQGFEKIGASYMQQVEQLKKIRSVLQEQAKQLKGKLAAKPRSRPVAIQGDHRTYITKRQSDAMPMVPGPDEPQ